MAGAGEEAWRAITTNVLRVTDALVDIRLRSGAVIHLDIEPEPDCSIENTDETIRFFTDWLLPLGVPRLSAAFGLTEADARHYLLDHVRVCFGPPARPSRPRIR